MQLSVICLLSLSLFTSLALTAAEPNPPKLAGKARFDILGTPETGSLDQGAVSSGTGSIIRMPWMKPEEQGNSYTAEFSINRLKPTSIAVTFVPAKNGQVSLSLAGVYEEASKDVLYKEEVVWDAVKVQGAKVTEGAFEKMKQPVRTWHNTRATMILAAQAGKVITLELQAHAAVPEGFKDMKRFVSGKTPAYRAVKKFERGANFGNYLEVPPGQNWGVTITSDDFVHVREAGFDHIRLPVGWHHYTGPAPDFKISDKMFGRVDELVSNANKNGLGIIINIHHFDAFTSDPDGQKAKFYAIWKQLAEHYAKAPDSVAFELINEPKDKATTPVLNPIYAEAIKIIRETNPHRVIFAGPGRWNSISELDAFQLPDDDNIIVTVHCYEPFYFTHQGATWAGPDTKTKGIIFPGPPTTPLVPDPNLQLSPGVKDWIKRYNTLPTEKNPSSPMAFRGLLQKAHEWSEYYGRPIHVGEFGCYEMSDAESRNHFYEAFRRACDEYKLAWAIWDWNAGFHYWDVKKNQPVPGMHEALFGK